MNVRDREEAVVARLRGLAPHLDGEPDAAFRTATRARLVAMAAVRTPEPEPARGLRRLVAARARAAGSGRLRSRLTAGLAGAAMAVTALATVVAVSTGAQPGDALYGLKRGTELTQLAMAGDARGQTLLTFAGTRLAELAALDAGADPVLVLDTLATMDDQTRQGAAWLTDRAVTTEDTGPLDDLAVWTADQSGGLAALAPRMPEQAAEATESSLTLLHDVTARVEGLRPATVAPGGGTSTPSLPGGPTPSLPPTTDGVPLPGGPSVPGGPTGGTGSGSGPESGSGTGSGSGSGSGGSGIGVEVPPVGPLLPPLPAPELPGTPILPGTQNGGGSTTTTAPPPLDLDVCLPPLPPIGTC